ncbi:MAG: glycosyltransferase, partial [Candidatus Pacearchaeota archaeon]
KEKQLSEINELRGSIDDLERENRLLSGEKEKLLSEINELRKVFEVLKREKDEINSRLTLVYNTKTWKLNRLYAMLIGDRWLGRKINGVLDSLFYYLSSFRIYSKQFGTKQAIKRSFYVIKEKSLTKIIGKDTSKLNEERLYIAYQEKLKRDFYLKRSRIKKDINKEIEKLIKRNNYKGIIFYPSPITWNTPLFQRPHQILREISKRGYLVFFLTINPKADNVECLRKISENLYLVENINILKILKNEKIILWITWTPTIVCRELFPNSILIYDWIDELDVFYLYSPLMDIDHRKLLSTADIVFVSSSSLLEKAMDVRNDAILIPNAVCVEDFKVDKNIIPEDMVSILSNGKPVIGFYGSLEEWRMDYNLINYLCRECPDMNFVLIGPSYDGSFKKLKMAGNLFYLSAKKYEELKFYLKNFDVAFIPYKVDRITRSVFPVKLLEYMAGGKPIVTTNLNECKRFKGVLTSNDYEDFIQNIRKAITLKDDPIYINNLKAEAYSNTWEKRVDNIINVIERKKMNIKSVRTTFASKVLNRLIEMLYNIPVLRNMAKAVNVLKRDRIRRVIFINNRKVSNKVNVVIHQNNHKDKLEEIINSKINNLREIIIYPPAVDWNLPLFQRPQHLAIQLSRLGCLYFYCTANHTYDNIKGFLEYNNNLFLTNRYDLVINKLKGWILVSSISSVTLKDIIRFKEKGFKIIYDYLDEIHPDISGTLTNFFLERHKMIDSNHVDLVLTISNQLYSEMINRFPQERVILLPNGVEYEHFHIEKKIEECPEDIKNIVLDRKPIIGYHGALARWIDYDLINYIAKKRPDWNIVLIGWNYDGSMNSLHNCHNIYYLGIKQYKELPKYSIWFDVAIIPFKEGDIAKSTSPIKLYEYMAMNKPTVVTKDLIECHRYNGVLIADNREDFIQKLEDALELKDNPEFIKMVDDEAKKNTWQSRAYLITNLMMNYEKIATSNTKSFSYYVRQ